MEFTDVKPPYHWQPLKQKSLSNELYLLNDQYFVKKSKLVCHKFLNLPNQLRVVQIIQAKNYTLPIYETKLSEGHLWTLMPYYEKTFTFAEYRRYPDLIWEVAHLVKQLHATQIDNKAIVQWDAEQQLELYSSLFKTPKKLLPIKTALLAWLKTYQPEDIVLCHNDLVGANIITTNQRWYLIDWDFACLNDRLFDVASFVSETLNRADDIAHWYNLFNIGAKEIKILQQWITYQNFIWYHWAAYLYKATKNKDYKIIAKNKISKLT